MENLPEPTKLEKQQFILLGLFSLILSGLFYFTDIRSADLMKFVPPGKALFRTSRNDEIMRGEPVIEFGPTALNKIRLNTSPREDLLLCPGIGPVAAETILAERQKGLFTSWENFSERVWGMGPAKIAVLKNAGVQIGP